MTQHTAMDPMGALGRSSRRPSPAPDNVAHDGDEPHHHDSRDDRPGLDDDGGNLFTWLRSVHPHAQPVALGHAAQGDGSHERLERRRVWSPEAHDGLISGARWAGVTNLVIVESIRSLGEGENVERCHYLRSLPGHTPEAEP